MRSRLIGQNAGRLLHKRLGSAGQPPEKILLNPELVVRDSSCPPRQGSEKSATAAPPDSDS
jgi:DNA-binding LacI/PurR family transcriptional regulator